VKKQQRKKYAVSLRNSESIKMASKRPMGHIIIAHLTVSLPINVLDHSVNLSPSTQQFLQCKFLGLL